MPTRLLLGCADECRVFVDRLADDDAGYLRGIVDDEDAAEWLTEQGIPVERGDPTDEAVLASVEAPVETVVVAVEGRARTERTARRAREVFPDATILAEAAAADVADRTVDASGVVARRLLDRVASPGGERALGLRSALQATTEPLAVVMHDNPDPDAIASAIGLVAIAEALGVEAVPCYFGEIAHQENRALVNLLHLDLRELASPDAIDSFGSIALVDHARPGVNDQLPEETPVDIVVDHHPPRGPVEATYVDLREELGATSTIVASYFETLGVELTTTVATALLYGIRVDTDDFTREVSPMDYEAAAALLDGADESVLERVEAPSVTADTFDTIARAMDNRKRHDSVVTACVGHLRDRDALAQAADRLLDLEDVTATMVFGIMDETVYVSARARGAGIDLGAVLRDAFDRIGSAGGHDDMAGAQLPVGMLVAHDETDRTVEIVERVLVREFLDALELPSSGRPSGQIRDHTANAVFSRGDDATMRFDLGWDES